MLSRVANSIYWISRFVERAENYARFIDVNHRLTMDLPPGFEEQWSPLIETTGDRENFVEHYGEDYRKEDVINFLVSDMDNYNSILSCLTLARENARTVREVISTEMWLEINALYINLRDGVSSNDWIEEKLTDILNLVKLGSHSFNGIMDSTFSHEEGWHFGMMGRYLERADKTARILDMKYYYLLPRVQDVNTPLDMLQWSSLLMSASAFEMYRKKHGRSEMKKIISFLTLDRYFPRSMLFCLIQAEYSLHEITGNLRYSFSTKAEKELGKLRSELDYTDIDDIMGIGLHQYLDNFQTKDNAVSDAVFETFFTLRD